MGVIDFLGSAASGTKSIQKLMDGVYIIPETMIGDCNVYLIVGDDGRISMIDSSNGFTSKSIVDAMNKNGFSIDNLDTIIMTHGHFDHVGGVYKFADMHDFSLVASQGEAPFIESGNSGFICPFMPLKCKPINVDVKLREGDVVDVGNLSLRVVETPGHTSGSICLYDRSLKVLFSGDTVFTEGSFGRYDLQTGSLEQLTNSIKRLSELDVDLLMPGHMSPVRDGSKHIRAALSIISTCI